MIDLLAFTLNQLTPGILVIWMAFYVRRRIAQCEARCARELERMISLLPVGDAPTQETVLVEPEALTSAEPIAPLPVAVVRRARWFVPPGDAPP